MKNGNHKLIRQGEYNGHPLLVFGEEKSKYPFQFGQGKAKQLLAGIEEIGLKEFHALLKEFASAK